MIKKFPLSPYNVNMRNLFESNSLSFSMQFAVVANQPSPSHGAMWACQLQLQQQQQLPCPCPCPGPCPRSCRCLWSGPGEGQGERERRAGERTEQAGQHIKSICNKISKLYLCSTNILPAQGSGRGCRRREGQIWGRYVNSSFIRQFNRIRSH